MQALDVVIEDPRWQAAGLASLAARAVPTALAHLALDPDLAEITLLGCDDRRIAALNGDFRGKNRPTNVLSWPSQDRAPARPGAPPPAIAAGPDGLFELGDIAISYDTCAAEAGAAGQDLATHATHLLVHGTLHLLGYDHITDPDAALMEGLETEILGKLGLDDPYKDR